MKKFFLCVITVFLFALVLPAAAHAENKVNSIFYDDQYVSIGWTRLWWVGGTSNTTYGSLNFSLVTAQPVTIYDILGDNAYHRISEAMQETRAASVSDFGEENLPEVAFHFDQENVYLTFSHGQLSGFTGTYTWPWGLELTIKR